MFDYKKQKFWGQINYLCGYVVYHVYLNAASSGILVWSSDNVIIDGNEVERANNKGAQSENECITVGETDSFEVKNNHVHDGYPVRGEGIVLKDGSSSGLIYRKCVYTLDEFFLMFSGFSNFAPMTSEPTQIIRPDLFS